MSVVLLLIGFVFWLINDSHSAKVFESVLQL